MQRLKNAKTQKHCSVGLLECIFIALSKIGSLCSLRVQAQFYERKIWQRYERIVRFHCYGSFISSGPAWQT